MRMIPLADLANASLPESNAVVFDTSPGVNVRITASPEGCAIVAKVPVARGEELCIDYNHRDAISMLGLYGCSLGLERSSTVTQLRWRVPQYLEAFGMSKYESAGVQL